MINLITLLLKKTSFHQSNNLNNNQDHKEKELLK